MCRPISVWFALRPIEIVSQFAFVKLLWLRLACCSLVFTSRASASNLAHVPPRSMIDPSVFHDASRDTSSLLGLPRAFAIATPPFHPMLFQDKSSSRRLVFPSSIRESASAPRSAMRLWDKFRWVTEVCTNRVYGVFQFGSDFEFLFYELVLPLTIEANSPIELHKDH